MPHLLIATPGAPTAYALPVIVIYHIPLVASTFVSKTIAVPTVSRPWLVIVACLTTLCCGCAPAFEEEFPDAYSEYLSKPEHKALAVTQDHTGAYAYGSGWGHQSKERAVNEAMTQCSVRQQLYEVEGECEIYMIDNQKVEEE